MCSSSIQYIYALYTVNTVNVSVYSIECTVYVGAPALNAECASMLSDHIAPQTGIKRAGAI